MKQAFSDPAVPFVAGKDQLSGQDLEDIQNYRGVIQLKPGIELHPSDLAELSKLLGRNIADRDDLLLAARNLSTLSVEGIEGAEITLDSYLLNRLRSRCQENDFGAFVRRVIVEQLAAFCGC